MKIGLLGGSFNPPHFGHLYISLQSLKHLRLKQVWWLPAKRNPLKQKARSSFKKRLTLCQKIIAGYSQIKIKDYEAKLNSNYTIDLLYKLLKQYPKEQFYWIIGADNAANFHLWRHWRQIIKSVPIIIIDRDNYLHKVNGSRMFSYCKKLTNSPKSKYKKHCYFLKLRKCSISSTSIRENKKNNVSDF